MSSRKKQTSLCQNQQWNLTVEVLEFRNKIKLICYLKNLSTKMLKNRTNCNYSSKALTLGKIHLSSKLQFRLQIMIDYLDGWSSLASSWDMSAFLVPSIIRVKMAWDLELTEFIAVAAVTRWKQKTISLNWPAQLKWWGM